MCDPIDDRHKGVLTPEVWGDGDPEGVRQRAAEAMKDTARAAAQLGVEVVTGFTGSPTWHMVYSFPPNDFDEIERGYQEFAERWGADHRRVRGRGREVRARGAPDRDRLRLRDAQGAGGDRRPAGFGINFDPSHFEHQFLDSAAFITEFAPKIHHAHIKDSVKRLDGRSSILGGHLNFGEPGRGWDFVSPGTATSTSSMIRALNRIGYDGPLSIEWEDSGMDRDWGAGRAGVRAPHGLRSLRGRVRRRVREGVLMSEVGFVTMGKTSRPRRSSRSGSACSATRSWARPTRTRTRRWPT